MRSFFLFSIFVPTRIGDTLWISVGQCVALQRQHGVVAVSLGPDVVRFAVAHEYESSRLTGFLWFSEILTELAADIVRFAVAHEYESRRLALLGGAPLLPGAALLGLVV